MTRLRYRVVLDTNVIISSLWSGPPRDIVAQWQEGAIQTVVTEEIITEYLAVLSRFNLAPEIEEDFLLLFSKQDTTVLTKPCRIEKVIIADPADNKFLACALAGKADYIISGDRHLLDLSHYQDIPIVTPRQFLDVGDSQTGSKRR